jgi:transposase
MTPVTKRRDARSLDHKTLEEMRRLAVRRVGAGESQRSVARALEVHHGTVNKWMAAYRKGGDEGIASTTGGGRPRRLTPRQEARLRRIIVGKDPRQLNFGVALWSLPIVAQLVERLFGVVLHTTTVMRYLHRMGLTPQRPARRAFRRDDEECRSWMLKEFPRIVRAAKRRQATLLFEDEAGVHEDGPIDRTWGERGKRPVVRITGLRRRVNVISAISPRGRLWFRCYEGRLNAERFIEFLDALLHDFTKPIDLILDKHPAHVAASVRRFAHEHRSRLRLHFLPGYAPDLNPDEHVWGYLKGVFRRSPIEERDDLSRSVEQTMQTIGGDPTLVKSFFHNPEVEYVRKALKW